MPTTWLEKIVSGTSRGSSGPVATSSGTAIQLRTSRSAERSTVSTCSVSSARQAIASGSPAGPDGLADATPGLVGVARSGRALPFAPVPGPA